MTRYRTIVADPPWDHSDGTGVTWAEKPRTTHLPYPTMTVPEISGIPVTGLAERRAHLYLWTTTRYLEASFTVARGWGFQPAAVLVWCKPPRGWSVGGTFASNVEFILFGVRHDGNAIAERLGVWLANERRLAGLTQRDVAQHFPSRTGGITGCVANWELGLNVPSWEQWQILKRVIGFGNDQDYFLRELHEYSGELTAIGSSRTRWFQWPRGEHSAKPEAFLDMVETVSPGPYLELFARRQRLGWDTWGNEALEHVELAT